MATAVYEMCRSNPRSMALYQSLPGFVAESPEQNKNQIQEPTNPKEPEGEKPDYPGTRFANVETMDAELTEEKA